MRTEKATQMGRLAVPNGGGAATNNNGGKNAKKQTAGKRAIVTMNRNKKTTQILLIIAGTFAVCWLPYHLFMISKCTVVYTLNNPLIRMVPLSTLP